MRRILPSEIIDFQYAICSSMSEQGCSQMLADNFTFKAYFYKKMGEDLGIQILKWKYVKGHFPFFCNYDRIRITADRLLLSHIFLFCHLLPQNGLKRSFTLRFRERTTKTVIWFQY